MSQSKMAAFSICFLLLCGTQSLAQERREVPEFRMYSVSPCTETVDAIQDLIEKYKDAWGKQDVESFIALHADDVEWINAYARMFQDSTSLGDFLKNRLFPAFDRNVSLQESVNMKTISIRHLGDDVAIVHMYTDGERGPSRNSGEERRRTHFHLIVAKQSNKWEIKHTAIMDTR